MIFKEEQLRILELGQETLNFVILHQKPDPQMFFVASLGEVFFQSQKKKRKIFLFN